MEGTARLAQHDAHTWHGWHDNLGTNFHFGTARHGPARGHPGLVSSVLLKRVAQQGNPDISNILNTLLRIFEISLTPCWRYLKFLVCPV